MRVFAVALAFLLWPTAALADDAVTIVSRDVPLHGERTLAAAPPARFDMVGLHWEGPGTPLFRTRSTATGRWSTWLPADDDWGRDGVWRKGNPEWTGAADAIQYRLRGKVRRLRAYFLWSPVEKVPLRRMSIAGSPAIIPRLSWGADESIRRARPLYASSLAFALVHHTVNSNDYGPGDSAALVRGIQAFHIFSNGWCDIGYNFLVDRFGQVFEGRKGGMNKAVIGGHASGIEIYHVKGNGWNDIGYNFLVDRYGQIFEGRYGGVDKNVVGAHSQGFNTGSVGVAVIGTYNSSPISAAAKSSVEKLLAWRLDIAHVDPLSTLNYISGGNTKFPAGIPVFLRAISGHRDTYFTDCPGNALYSQLPGIAGDVAKVGLPKLYAPATAGTIGGPVRFTAKLSSSLPWTVTVADSKGAVAASGGGTGTTVDWTWDATAAPPGRYAWTIAAGPTVRSATGTIGTKLPPLALTALAAKPTVLSPNGDSVDDTAVVTYTLSVAAEVSASLVDRNGVTVASFFDQQQMAGKQSFTLAPDPSVLDGDYTLVLAAKTVDGQAVQASVPIVIDRTVTAFSVSPSAISPNGDGVQDAASFSFTLAVAAHVHLAIDLGKNEIAAVEDASLPAGVVPAMWAPEGVPDGRYTVVLSEDSGVTHSLPLVVDTTPPRLRLLSPVTRRVSVSEAATLTLGRATVKVAKLCVPRSNCAASCIAATSSGEATWACVSAAKTSATGAFQMR